MCCPKGRDGMGLTYYWVWVCVCPCLCNYIQRISIEEIGWALIGLTMGAIVYFSLISIIMMSESTSHSIANPHRTFPPAVLLTERWTLTAVYLFFLKGSLQLINLFGIQLVPCTSEPVRLRLLVADQRRNCNSCISFFSSYQKSPQHLFDMQHGVLEPLRPYEDGGNRNRGGVVGVER